MEHVSRTLLETMGTNRQSTMKFAADIDMTKVWLSMDEMSTYIADRKDDCCKISTHRCQGCVNLDTIWIDMLLGDPVMYRIAADAE